MYGGGEVAVKVQRPLVQSSVALDLLLMRRFAAFCQTLPQVPATAISVSASVVKAHSCKPYNIRILLWPVLGATHAFADQCKHPHDDHRGVCSLLVPVAAFRLQRFRLIA